MTALTGKPEGPRPSPRPTSRHLGGHARTHWPSLHGALPGPAMPFCLLSHRRMGSTGCWSGSRRAAVCSREVMGVVDRITARADRLTPAERKVAAILAGEPQSVAFGTVATVANKA